MDDPFSPQELDASITACKVNSSLGLDQFDCKLIAAFPPDIRSILLDITIYITIYIVMVHFLPYGPIL